MIVKNTLYINGSIRNADGKLVAFYDQSRHTVEIDGYLETFHVSSMDHAMDLVSEKLKLDSVDCVF